MIQTRTILRIYTYVHVIIRNVNFFIRQARAGVSVQRCRGRRRRPIT